MACGWSPPSNSVKEAPMPIAPRMKTAFEIRHWIYVTTWISLGLTVVLPLGFAVLAVYCLASWLLAAALPARRELANLCWGTALAVYISTNLLLVIYLREHRSILLWLHNGGPFYRSIYSTHEQVAQLMVLQPFGAFVVCLSAGILLSHKIDERLLLGSFVGVGMTGLLNFALL